MLSSVDNAESQKKALRGIFIAFAAQELCAGLFQIPGDRHEPRRHEALRYTIVSLTTDPSPTRVAWHN